MAVAVVLTVLGLGLVLVSAERLVDATVEVAGLLRVSPFVLGVVVLGFDPENLAVGIAGSAERAPGLAAGTVLGSVMIAVALAAGVAAVAAPMRFSSMPYQVLALPAAAVLLLGALSLDGRLSRMDGLVLLVAYGLDQIELLWLVC